MNPQDTKSTESKSAEKPYQSKVVTKFSEVADRVGEGTQSFRKLGLRKIAQALNTIADRITHLNQHLDLDAPIDEHARASSKRRIEKAASRAAEPVDADSEQNPRGPRQSGAV